MLFNSPEFLFLFLPVFLLLYLASPQTGKNCVLLFASLFFYFTTSGELTVILILSIVFNYYAALRIDGARMGRKAAWLFGGVAVNLFPLAYYKYSKFFLSSVGDALNTIGVHGSLPKVNPILPIGISFFTFQAISYIADVYLQRVKPTRNLIDFGMYHSCFPQLIAGPIVRYEEIEEQVHRRVIRTEDVFNGITQFCFGLSKKVILADTMGVVADRLFRLPLSEMNASSAWVGALAYTLQIYFDFSGYSDMAIGLGRILGFWYPANFNQPYRSCSVTEFWRRWHMTLSRWFKDYVYIPLGGNRRGTIRTFFNLLLVFFLCGLWHGAAYTFVIWGFYHGLLLIFERLLAGRFRFRVPSLVGWCYTIVAVMVGWVIFRSETLVGAFAYLHLMFGLQDFSLSINAVRSTLTPDKITFMALAITFALVPYSWVFADRDDRYSFQPIYGVAGLICACLAIVMMSVNGFSPFIYFRF